MEKKNAEFIPCQSKQPLEKTDMPFLPPWWAKINVVNCLLAENE